MLDYDRSTHSDGAIWKTACSVCPCCVARLPSRQGRLAVARPGPSSLSHSLYCFCCALSSIMSLCRDWASEAGHFTASEKKSSRRKRQQLAPRPHHPTISMMLLCTSVQRVISARNPCRTARTSRMLPEPCRRRRGVSQCPLCFGKT